MAARDPERARAFAAKHHDRPGSLDTYDELRRRTPRSTPSTTRCPTACTAAGPWPPWPPASTCLCEKPFTADADEARDGRRRRRGPGPAGGHGGLPLPLPPAGRPPGRDRRRGRAGPGRRTSRSPFSAPLAKRGDIRYRLDLAGGRAHGHGLLHGAACCALLAGGEPTVVVGPGQAVLARRRPGHAGRLRAARGRHRPHPLLDVLLVGAGHARHGARPGRAAAGLQPLRRPSSCTG